MHAKMKVANIVPPALLSIQFGLVVADNYVAIPAHYAYSLPGGCTSTLDDGFVDTENVSSELASLLSSASKAALIAYDKEFASIVGSNPTLSLLAGPLDRHFANEAAVYVETTNSVWFTGVGPDGHTRQVMTINLTDNTVSRAPNNRNIVEPVGGRYHDGKVYLTYFGNRNVAGGVLAVDAVTGKTETVVNSYFGLRLNGPDDVVWAQRGDRRAMFFTDVDFASLLNVTGPPKLPNAVWRFEEQTQTLRPVISQADIPDPNGVAVNRESTRLYVTDTPVSYLRGKGLSRGTGSPAIYVYDLKEDLVPVNKRLFGMARAGVPDGIKVDMLGRVWTAEGEGIVVRSDTGKVLGVFNAKVLLEDETQTIANFALTDNRLIILAATQIWSVKLAS